VLQRLVTVGWMVGLTAIGVGLAFGLDRLSDWQAGDPRTWHEDDVAEMVELLLAQHAERGWAAGCVGEPGQTFEHHDAYRAVGKSNRRTLGSTLVGETERGTRFVVVSETLAVPAAQDYMRIEAGALLCYRPKGAVPWPADEYGVSG
jgi:hypothetical protein